MGFGAVFRRARLAVAVATLVVAGLAGLGVAIAGFYNVAAVKGHWPITAWFLHFSMERSVATHSLTIAPPPLDDEALVEEGLRHFDYACAVCHSTPGHDLGPMVRYQLPPPPDLADVVPQWKPRELFWIVKNGIKYTAMPGWPAQTRDDEVWAVVAALLRLPKLDQAGYERLVNEATPASANGRQVTVAGGRGDRLGACDRCHGTVGEGGGAGAFPRLAGQRRAYLAETLHDYKTSARASGIMQIVAAQLSDSEITQVAAYYADAAPIAVGQTTDLPRAQQGAAIAEKGLPDRGIPACSACHDTNPSYTQYPNLNGQSAFYLRGQLRLWRAGTRGGSALANIMSTVARQLDDGEIDALAAYYAAKPVFAGSPAKAETGE